MLIIILLEVSACLSSPCGNSGATCIDVLTPVKTYKCLCNSGYWNGQTCFKGNTYIFYASYLLINVNDRKNLAILFIQIEIIQIFGIRIVTGLINFPIYELNKACCLQLIDFTEIPLSQVVLNVNASTFYVGQPLSLQCAAYSNPLATISWTKDDVQIIASSNLNFFSNSTSGYIARSFLHINSLMRASNGVYACNALDSSGSIVRSNIISIGNIVFYATYIVMGFVTSLLATKLCL